MSERQEFLNSLHAEAATRINYYPAILPKCSREGCDKPGVPSESDECRDHAIMTTLEIMEAIGRDPNPQPIDCYHFGVCQDELERLRGMAR